MTLRYLVVANQTLGGASLSRTVASRAKEGASFHIVVPATEPAHHHDTPPPGSALEVAQARLEEELARFQAEGVDATGEVGAADPMEAIREALQHDHYVGLIISTLPARISRWVHLDLPHRVVREFKLPVEWVETRGEDEPQVVHLVMPPGLHQRVAIDVVRPSGGPKTPPLAS